MSGISRILPPKETPLGWGNGLVVFHRDSLFGNELLELVREFPGVTRGLRKLGQRLAFGLLDIEDESGTESGQPIVDGKSNKEIASRLNLSANTWPYIAPVSWTRWAYIKRRS